MRFDVPLPADLVEELISFWISTFGESIDPDLPPEVFLGREHEHNRISVYLDRQGGKLAGTCALTVSIRVPILGGVAEVATHPELRRSGIATELCRRAVDQFREGGGQALFLGTGNPDAARIYYRLGWRKLAGANVMANISGGSSPEAFLVDYFRDRGTATVRAASPEDRIPMIPLLVSPHDWHVLDSNAAMFSTRYAVQGSCMGLYSRYEAVARDNRGSWFSAVTGSGRIVGLSTARLDASGGCRVDAFTHKDHEGVWNELVETAMKWGARPGTQSLEATVPVEDEEKRYMFESIGFHTTDRAEPFDLDGEKLESVRLVS